MATTKTAATASPASPFESPCECAGAGRYAIEAAAEGGSRMTCLSCGRSRIVKASNRIEMRGSLEILGTAEPEAEAPVEPEIEGEAGDEDRDGETEEEDAIERGWRERAEEVRAELLAANLEIARLEAKDRAREDEEGDGDADDGTE